MKANQPIDIEKPKTHVKQIIPFDNGLVIVFDHYVDCYLLSEYDGWHCVFESRYIENEINFVDFHFESTIPLRFMLAICEKQIVLWSTPPFSLLENFNHALYFRSRQHFSRMQKIEEIGKFSLNNYQIDSMFFIGSQLGNYCNKTNDQNVTFNVFFIQLQSTKKKDESEFGTVQDGGLFKI